MSVLNVKYTSKIENREGDDRQWRQVQVREVQGQAKGSLKFQSKVKAGTQSIDSHSEESDWDPATRGGIQGTGLLSREKARGQLRLKVQKEWANSQTGLRLSGVWISMTTVVKTT